MSGDNGCCLGYHQDAWLATFKMSHNYHRHQQWSRTRMLIHTKESFLCSKHHRNRGERCDWVGGCSVRQKKKKKENRHLQRVSDWVIEIAAGRGGPAVRQQQEEKENFCVAHHHVFTKVVLIRAKIVHKVQSWQQMRTKQCGPLLESRFCSPLINISNLGWTEWANRDSYKYTLHLSPVD